MVSPLQVPMMADVLVKHGRMAPVVIAMVQSGNQEDRIRDYVANEQYYQFIMTELLPFLQTHYRIDPTNLGIGGASAGAIAGMDATLKNPAIFSGLMMFSPPLGKGVAQDKLAKYIDSMKNARVLPQRIFHSVGRYEAKARFLLPNQLLAKTLNERQDTDYRFVELASGHGLVAFRSALPEALAHTFPGYQSLWENR
jgi:enterochelin esterase-like enzyme